VRQFVFVRDVARLLVRALDAPPPAGTTIVAADDGITIAQLAESIARIMDYRGAMRFDAAQPEGVRVKRLLSTRFSSQFPDFAFTPLTTGLRATIQWFLEQRCGTADGIGAHAVPASAG
jgi:GDP-L-fucose synthase